MKVAVAISGKGRSLENLIEQQNRYSYEIAGVISSNPNAEGNKIATANGLPLLVIDFQKTATQVVQTELENWLYQFEVNFIALAGFLKKFPTLDQFNDRVINIHPALLPKYGGKGMYGIHVQAVWRNKEKFSGASIHYVNGSYDEGEIIAQSTINIEGLTIQQIASKVFELEKLMYPEILNLFGSDCIDKSSLPLNMEFQNINEVSSMENTLTDENFETKIYRFNDRQAGISVIYDPFLDPSAIMPIA